MSLTDTLVDQVLGKLKKKKIRRRIVNEAVSPIIDETLEKYSGPITIGKLVLSGFALLLFLNLYYNIKLTRKIAKLEEQ